MKIWLLLPVTLLTFAATALSDQLYDEAVAKILNETAVFSKDEMSQMRFTASFSSNYTQPMLEYALYNPSRDRAIRGIVVSIQSKDANSGREQSFDLFISMECGPLQCTYQQQTVPVLGEMAKQSPKALLKEVHYVVLQKAPEAKQEPSGSH